MGRRGPARLLARPQRHGRRHPRGPVELGVTVGADGRGDTHGPPGREARRDGGSWSGPQGTGKSTAWAWLLPGEPQRSLWFSDGLSFHDDQKTTAEALQGMVLVDASEMTGSTKADVETIKKFRSRTTDNIRLTFRRDPSTLLRRCMIVGTTNDPRCLPTDASGNRRFLPVPCTAGDPADTRASLDEPRDQLWAEALHRVRTNHETAYLPDNLKSAQSNLTEQYRAVDEVAEEIIGEWRDANPLAVTTNQVARGINWTPDSRSISRITTVLKQRGDTPVEYQGAHRREPHVGVDAAWRARETRGLMPSRIRVDGERRTGIETLGDPPSIGHYATVVRGSKDVTRVVVSRRPRGPWRVWTPDDVVSAVPPHQPLPSKFWEGVFCQSGRRTFAPSCPRPFRTPAPTISADELHVLSAENYPMCRSWPGLAWLFLCSPFSASPIRRVLIIYFYLQYRKSLDRPGHFSRRIYTTTENTTGYSLSRPPACR